MEKNENEVLLFENIVEEKKHYRSYIPSDFILASLPLRNVMSPSFQRKMNNVELYITGSGNVPYGKYARLLLSILTTHAVLQGDDENDLVITYDSLKSLTDEMLLPKQRGKDIKEQLMLFSFSSFQFRERLSEKVKRDRKTNYLFEELKVEDDKLDLQWNSHGNIPFMTRLSWVDINEASGKKETIASMKFSIELSKQFVKICKDHSVPIDYTVYSSIPSALGKDLYCWLIYRNNCLGEGGHIFVPRKSLLEQFYVKGQEEKEDDKTHLERSAYSRICDQLRIIKEKYYPGLKLEIDKDGNGVTLLKSPPVIQEKDKRYILITQDIIGIQ